MADPGDGHGQVAEWTRLHACQAELRLAIGETSDPEERAALQHELVDVRLAVARLDAVQIAVADSDHGPATDHGPPPDQADPTDNGTSANGANPTANGASSTANGTSSTDNGTSPTDNGASSTDNGTHDNVTSASDPTANGTSGNGTNDGSPAEADPTGSPAAPHGGIDLSSTAPATATAAAPPEDTVDDRDFVTVTGRSTATGDDGDIDDLIESLTGTGAGASAVAAPRPPIWDRPSFRTGAIALALVGILLSVSLSWLAFHRSSGTQADAGATSTTAPTDSDSDLATDLESDIRSVLAAVGLDSIEVEVGENVVHLRGSVPDEASRATAIRATEALLPDTTTLDTSALTVGEPAVAAPDPQEQVRAAAFQAELDRIVASTPLIFDVGGGELTQLHQRILNAAVLVINAYPDLPVRIVGHTDGQGDPEANRQLSQQRAAAVQAYFVSQGVPAARLIVDAQGEGTSSGSADLAGLERRVELKVAAGGTAAAPQPGAGPLRVAVVAPSARNDLAFTQSMVDAVNVIAGERGNVEVKVADNLFVPADAAAAVRSFADEGYDLVIAHGVEFGPDLVTIVTDHPDTTFAWGTATDTFGLPNLYAYDAAAEQGGYVMGAMSSMLSTKRVIGVIGPIDVGDAKRYVNGFRSGAEAAVPKPTVTVAFTGSFGDIALASETATAQVAGGADVLTGTGEMVVGAISVAQASGALWFGTQSSQASLAPQQVVASQVYHWEVVLRPIVADIDAGVQQGRGFVADLANGGLVIDYNPAYALRPDVRQRADELTAQIASGALVVARG